MSVLKFLNPKTVFNGLRGLLTKPATDYGFDPYEREPVQASELKAIFQLQYGKADPRVLTKREQFEHDSLSTIRGILYS